jgi:hypothetical protein
MANNVRVTELDFDTIKENIKTYLRAQSQFTDYDFDASNLSVLMDILAYNTHYNAVLANMVSNEMFLDTALKRSSVVSLAKHLNYIPRSRRAATAVVDVSVQNTTSTPNYLTLEPYTQFTTNIDGTAYNFFNINSYSTTPSSGVYTFSGVKLYQGRKLEYYWTVGATPGPTTKYEIPNLDIDTNTIQVAIQYGGVGSFSDVWTQATDLQAIDETSKVFFLQENTRGYYEIFFGDNVLGQQLSQNDVIKISYLITDGADANVSNNLTVGWSTNSIAGEISNDRTITTITKPSGGADKESTESVRFRSINNYTAQGRAVTAADHATLIADAVPGADSVNVWGGENNNPPKYGTSFISIKPKTGYVLTDAEKTRIVNDVLTPRGIMTASYEFVDPNYTYVGFTVDIRYVSTRTTRTSNEISGLANTVIETFMADNLSKFTANFYHSQLEEQIMNIDDAILSANVKFFLSKRIPAVPGVRVEGISTLQLPIKPHPNEIRSSYFYFTVDGVSVPAQLRDVPSESPPDYEGTGVLQTFDLNTGIVVEDNVATVNYGTGEITFNASARLTLDGYLGTSTQFYLYAYPQESVGDIYPDFNEILVLDDSTADTASARKNGITINVTAVNN